MVSGTGAGQRNTMSGFRKGDKVTWSSHGGEAEGHVKSEKSGGEAVHKPSALRKN